MLTDTKSFNIIKEKRKEGYNMPTIGKDYNKFKDWNLTSIEVYLTELESGYSLIYYSYGRRETKYVKEGKGFNYNWLKARLKVERNIQLPKLDEYEWSKNAKGQKVGYWCKYV